MSCSIAKDYEEKSFEKGVQAFEVKGWRGFYQLIYEEFGLKEEKRENKLYINDYIWRGDKSDGPIQSTFYKTHNGNTTLEEHISSFAYAIRGKLEKFGLSIRELRERMRL
jgi:hypothetical protein